MICCFCSWSTNSCSFSRLFAEGDFDIGNPLEVLCQPMTGSQRSARLWCVRQSCGKHDSWLPWLPTKSDFLFFGFRFNRLVCHVSWSMLILPNSLEVAFQFRQLSPQELRLRMLWVTHLKNLWNWNKLAVDGSLKNWIRRRLVHSPASSGRWVATSSLIHSNFRI